MAKTLTIKDKAGVSYTLEYTRKSVEALERRGFKVSDVTEKPMTAVPLLFAGAFLARHKHMKQEEIDAIFKGLPNKDALVSKLVEMYHEPILAYMDEPEESEGNPSWEATW